MGRKTALNSGVSWYAPVRDRALWRILGPVYFGARPEKKGQPYLFRFRASHHFHTATPTTRMAPTICCHSASVNQPFCANSPPSNNRALRMMLRIPFMFFSPSWGRWIVMTLFCVSIFRFLFAQRENSGHELQY